MASDYYYEVLVPWTKAHELIKNRVGIVNELLGYRYHFDAHNALVLDWSDGRWRLVFDGIQKCEYRVYDLDTVRPALEWVKSFADACWMLRRAGAIVSIA